MTLRLLVATSDGDVRDIHASVQTNNPIYFAAPKDSEPGDEVVIFTHGDLIARAEVTTWPDPHQSFGNRPVWRASVSNFQTLDPPMPMDEVRRLMPDTWLWPSHPKRSFCTPNEEHQTRLLEIVELALKAPGAAPIPEAGSAATKPEPGADAGHEADPAVRKAIEDRAMVLAEEHYRAAGFAVENTAAKRPYDLRCVCEGLEVRVEVKGTRGRGAKVEVTIGEVLNARSTRWRTDLVVVREIDVALNNGLSVATGGKILVTEGWQPADEDLEAIRFRYTVNGPALDGERPQSPTDPTRLEVFTIGQKGLASVVALQEVIAALGIAHLVDARDSVPARGAWSRVDLAKAIGVPLLPVPANADPGAVIAPLAGRTLLLGTEKNPFQAQARVAFGNQHPEWEVAHILHRNHTKSPVAEAECIGHSELVSALEPNSEYTFFYLGSYSCQTAAEGTDAPARAKAAEQPAAPNAAPSLAALGAAPRG